VIFVFLADRT